RRRGRRRRAPSDLEGHTEVAVSEIFTAGSGENMRHGTLIHAWLEHTRWADQIPDDQALETIAHRNQIHVADLDDRITLLKKHLRQPEILSLLSEDSYHKREWLPFSDAVCQQILDTDELQIEVRCEYPFTINRDGETLNGTIDRLVLLRHGDAIVAADTIDYKTDHVEGQDAVDKKVEYYRGQLEAYRNAVRRVFGLDDDHIATRLAFLGAGQLADV
ncbi:MAG: PD-(D/E)XK nuclease family protein, partial [Planctomycetaceae bacterium]|nr:PD-(D/E)XK nuclease family protein [Planctomycetaceae bacterium]